MTDALSIALSGLRVQQTRLDAAANNIANATTSGRVPTQADPASTVYKPLTVSMTALNAGGVSAQVSANPDAYSVSFSPDDPHANAEGLIAVPNVDLVSESVNIMTVKAAFKANLSIIKTQDQMLGDLLDALT
jgi:flagellar basal-body rod protein FlgC